MNFLDKITTSDCAEFAGLCDRLFNIEISKFLEEVRRLNAWHQSGGEIESGEVKKLQRRWYSSLAAGDPDYSVYDDIFYFADAWLCWKAYSRKYLKSILSPYTLGNRSIIGDLGSPGRIVDVGCGIGYTTKAIEELFPGAEVIGTNLEGTKQWTLCHELGVKMKPSTSEVGPCSLVVAFEYFEHFLDPVAHLEEIIKTTAPDSLLIANSFGTSSIGHFITQRHSGVDIPSKGFGRLFNRELRRLGYQQQKTTVWNNKPSYWKRINESFKLSP